MTGPKILVGRESEAPRVIGPVPEVGWRLLGGAGFAFAVVAAADLALAWYPTGFGSAEWEFGTVTAVLGNLPLLIMGLGLLFAAAVGRGKTGLLKVISGLWLLLALMVLLMLVLYARRVPEALRIVTEPVLREGIQEGMVKTAVQGVLYPLAFAWMGIKGWRYASLEGT
jgi:hypothetical protein